MNTQLVFADFYFISSAGEICEEYSDLYQIWQLSEYGGFSEIKNSHSIRYITILQGEIISAS